MKFRNSEFRTWYAVKQVMLSAWNKKIPFQPSQREGAFLLLIKNCFVINSSLVHGLVSNKALLAICCLEFAI
jgi:hypothetical protein